MSTSIGLFHVIKGGAGAVGGGVAGGKGGDRLITSLHQLKNIAITSDHVQ